MTPEEYQRFHLTAALLYAEDSDSVEYELQQAGFDVDRPEAFTLEQAADAIQAAWGEAPNADEPLPRWFAKKYLI